MKLEELSRFSATRQAWVLRFGLAQIAVLVSGGLVAFATGFFGFLALAAAWMFLATRISRYVLGDRTLDQEIGQEVRRRVLSGGLHGQVPPDLEAAVQALEQHRRVMLPLSFGIAAVFLLGLAALALPAAGPWLFGLVAIAVIGGVGWAWSQRKTWARSRAQVDAWAEAARPLQPADPAPSGPQLQVIEGGRDEDPE